MDELAVASLALVAVLLVALAVRPRAAVRHSRWFFLLAAAALVCALLPIPGAAKYAAALATLAAFCTIPSANTYVDPKTGVLTREGLRAEIGQLLRANGTVACLAVATNHYQDLRAVHGNAAMAAVARDMAAFLTQACPGAQVAYLGRGRFLVAGGSAFDATDAQQRVTERFSRGWQVDGAAMVVPVRSIALPSTNRMASASLVLDTLEAAMDRALLDGDTLATTIDQDALDSMGQRAHVRRVLEHALDQGTLEVHYQPLYDTRVRRITRAEALARLRDDDGSYISPETFIAIAEESGVIDRLGEQIFELVCAFAGEHDLDALGLECINVNLSPLQCMSSELPKRLRAIAERHGVPMERLHLEITESAMVDISVLQQQMGVLVSTGSQFALDDYGTGYSNLTRVASLPFANIKLDHSIVWSYFEGTSSFMPSLISSFQEQGLEITAEGVETEEMARTLEDMGCDLLQGFYFSRALPAGEFVAYLRERG